MSDHSILRLCRTSLNFGPSGFNRLAAAASSFQLAPLLSKLAAASLVTASAGLGAYYAWSVGIEHETVLGLLFVLFAIGLEIAKPLAVLATFKAVGTWQLVRGGLLGILAMVAIAYSLSAELTLVAGTRGDVVAERQANLDASANAAAHARRARDRYDAAKIELGTLQSSRPAAELQAEIDALLLTPGADGCVTINGKVTREVCPKVAALKIERARADRRTELEAVLMAPLPVIAATSNVHPQSSSKSVRDADPGASALATYLAAMGLVLPVKVLTDWLALVPVIALELGSALAGVFVQTVSQSTRQEHGRTAPLQPRIGAVPDVPSQAIVNGVPTAIGTGVPELPAPVQLVARQELGGSVPPCPKKPLGDDDKDDGPSNGPRLGTALLSHLKANGGKVTAGQRGLAKLLDTSTTELNRTIHRLAAAGILLVTPDRLAGTTLELAGA